MPLKINHIGIVVKSIEKYVQNSVYDKMDIQVYDPVQQAQIALLKSQHNDPDMELIQPETEQATTYNFLQKTGGGLHHICYEIENETALNLYLTENRIKPIYGPVQAVLFDNKKVLFGYTRNREIVEFLITDNG